MSAKYMRRACRTAVRTTQIVDGSGQRCARQRAAFDVFSRRYENGATIVTSNLPFQKSTSLLASERLTGTLLDRITHHAHILKIEGT